MKKKVTVLTAKGKSEWKSLGKRKIIKNLKIQRKKDNIFGLHWVVNYETLSPKNKVKLRKR